MLPLPRHHRISRYLHGSGYAYMDDDTTPDGAGVISDDAQYSASKERAEGFAKGLAKVQAAVEYGSRQDDLGTGIFEKGQNHKPTEKELYVIKVENVEGLVGEEVLPVIRVQYFQGLNYL